MTGAKRRAGDVGERDFVIFHLTRTAFVTQLLDGFDDQEHSAYPWMVGGKPTTVGVDREIAIETQTSATDEVATFAAFAKAKVLERRQHGDGERVVDHRHVDVFVSDARALEGEAPGLRRSDLEKIPLAARRVPHRLARTENVGGLFLQIAPAFGRGNNGCAPAVGDAATIAQL